MAQAVVYSVHFPDMDPVFASGHVEFLCDCDTDKVKIVKLFFFFPTRDFFKDEERYC